MKKLFKILLFIVIFLASAWFALDRYSIYKLEESCKNWPVIDRNLRQLSEVIPTTRGTARFREIINSYKRINEIIKDTSIEEKSGDNSSRNKKSDLAKEYLYSELANASDTINVPDPEVLTILESIGEEIAKIRSILDDGLIVFPENVEKSPIAPIPNYILFRYLNQYILAKALLCEAEGLNSYSWEYLRSSAVIVDSLLNHPSVLHQALGTTLAIETLYCIRKMPAPFPEWVVGWPEIKSDMMILGFCANARSALTLAEHSDIKSLFEKINKWGGPRGEDAEISLVEKIISFTIDRQYLRLQSANYITRWKEFVFQLSKVEICSSEKPQLIWPYENVSAWMKSSIFNFIGYTTNMSGFWEKLRYTIIQRSGTESVMVAKVARDESLTNTWPPTLHNDIASCNALTWDYETDWNGNAKFEYTGKIYYEKPMSYITDNDLLFHVRSVD